MPEPLSKERRDELRAKLRGLPDNYFGASAGVTRALLDALDATERELSGTRAALTKINGIRNSIVGMQGFNFSEHAYPLVAALEEAGIKGAPYPEARANLGTLIEQRDAALARAETAERERDDERREVKRLRKLEALCRVITWNHNKYTIGLTPCQCGLCSAVYEADHEEALGINQTKPKVEK